jgi:hypothetical protein
MAPTNEDLYNRSTGYEGVRNKDPEGTPKWRLQELSRWSGSGVAGVIYKNDNPIGTLHFDTPEDMQWLKDRIEKP